ncbi:hypothetical protein ACG83_30125 [Frankia sp. R43]|uniref:hypothetical protein n=1 Tax=Frankia sp. R43 TaxID=269536 RepID=UPI0006CA31E9|nr:hypothetical protein [Frankia sp. R43]KPM52563.1 hypothetical protein ACG83_30125 [Frankia sp. R43]
MTTVPPDDPVSRLRAAAGARELERVCEEVAADLVAAGVEPSFRIESVDWAGDATLICADRYWRRRLLAEPTVEVAAHCARWLVDHADPAVRPEIIEKWALGYGFITRDTVEPAAEVTTATGRVLQYSAGSAEAAYFTALYHAAKLRADFWFEDLDRFVASSMLAVAAGPYRDGPLFTALRAFAACGMRNTARGTALVEAAWAAEPRSREVTDICLHAIDVAAPFDGQSELLRRYAEEAVATSPRAHLWWYRRARGERRCGDFDAALVSIETALGCLPAQGARTAHEHLQERYLGERDQIVTMMAARGPWTAPDQRPAPRWVLPLLAAPVIVALMVALTVGLTTTSALGDAIGRMALLATSLLISACIIAAVLHAARRSIP